MQAFMESLHVENSTKTCYIFLESGAVTHL